MEHARNRRRWGAAAAAAALAIGGAAIAAVPAFAADNGARHASATLVDGNGAPAGWAWFTEDSHGTVHVNVHVRGLSEGLHGIHIHQVGSCVGPAFTSAGGHHNPTGASHGTESEAEHHPHAGDLPNLTVNTAGIGHLNATTTYATLSAGPVGIFDTNGSALIIHAAEDDLHTDPTGNSGARVACGVIVDG
jgi:Cu-Zn family superoxide dismutase